LDFYTDGSLLHEGTLSAIMGFAWIQINASAPQRRFAASAILGPSAYKAELLAILLAVQVAPPNCYINFFTDCQNILSHADQVSSGGFLNTRNIFKTPHSSIWLLINGLIKKHNLIICWHKVPAHADDSSNNQVDLLAKSAAASSLNPLDLSVITVQDYFLPKWQSHLIPVHYRHFIRSTTYLKGVETWNSLNRIISYSPADVDWSTTGSLIQSSEPGTSFLASRTKRNLVSLLLEEIPTLDKLSTQQSHIYDASWLCFRCELDYEDFNHVWTCSASHNDINNIINQAKLLLVEELRLLSPSIQDTTLSQLGTLWVLPQFPAKNSHNFISFIDLIKGVVSTKLLSFLTSLEITRPQAVVITTKLLSYIRAACWDKIWVPRCAQFQDFIRSKGITPAQQRSGPPPGFSRNLSSGPTTDRSTSDRLSQPYATLVANYLSYGKGYPFPWCNNCVIFLVRLIRS